MSVQDILIMRAGSGPESPTLSNLHEIDSFDELEEPFDEKQTVKPSRTLSFRSDHPEALDWHFFPLAPYWVISQTAYELLTPHIQVHFRFFETKVNDVEYFVMVAPTQLALDCLNIEECEVECFPTLPKRIMRIKKYRFHEELIPENSIFHVPESGEVLCTYSIKEKIDRAGLKGFCFTDVETRRILS